MATGNRRQVSSWYFTAPLLGGVGGGLNKIIEKIYQTINNVYLWNNTIPYLAGFHNNELVHNQGRVEDLRKEVP